MPQPIDADLRGKVCIVTGANSGIGKEATRELARLGATVVMACRSEERGHEARSEILHEQPNATLDVLVVDLSSSRSIRDFVERFEQRYPRLDVLINNAAVWTERREVTEEGIELTWAVDQLGYFLLANLLLDRLKASAPSRIINVASRMAYGLDLNDVEFERRRFRGAKAYAQSKQANRMFTWELARRLEGTGVAAHAVHPGSVDTGLFRNFSGVMRLGIQLWLRFTRSPAEGADTVVWAAASPEIEGQNGKYFGGRKERRCGYRDPAELEALWALCERMTGLG